MRKATVKHLHDAALPPEPMTSDTAKEEKDWTPPTVSEESVQPVPRSDKGTQMGSIDIELPITADPIANAHMPPDVIDPTMTMATGCCSTTTV
jgi:hypothetical protein